MIAIHEQRKPRKSRLSRWHAHFLAMLPQIQQQASRACGGKDPEQREEFLAEVVANAYVAFVRLALQGRLDIVYPTPLANYAIRQTRAGRQVGTQLNVRDVASRHCQLTKGVTLERLDTRDEASGKWKEALVEDKRSTPAEIAAARIDFAAWLGSLSRRKRRVAQTLASGETTGDAARKHRLSPARISQIRSELRNAWCVFQGEAVPE